MHWNANIAVAFCISTYTMALEMGQKERKVGSSMQLFGDVVMDGPFSIRNIYGCPCSVSGLLELFLTMLLCFGNHVVQGIEQGSGT